ncbi:hypothetical protein NDU88_003433 [Pleurodeles waltl]|uniref:Uncharacterized protein n=1 Tax=Pleurodeles waltl TaxID=8319 RepID=A0AAV7T6F7_PLEWA|nr:hypothetical protein NDU88_003433 [Pleurodeles waltl]
MGSASHRVVPQEPQWPGPQRNLAGPPHMSSGPGIFLSGTQVSQVVPHSAGQPSELEDPESRRPSTASLCLSVSWCSRRKCPADAPDHPRCDLQVSVTHSGGMGPRWRKGPTFATQPGITTPVWAFFSSEEEREEEHGRGPLSASSTGLPLPYPGGRPSPRLTTEQLFSNLASSGARLLFYRGGPVSEYWLCSAPGLFLLCAMAPAHGPDSRAQAAADRFLAHVRTKGWRDLLLSAPSSREGGAPESCRSRFISSRSRP